MFGIDNADGWHAFHQEHGGPPSAYMTQYMKITCTLLYGHPNPSREFPRGWDLGRDESRLTAQQLQAAQDLRVEASSMVAEMGDEYMDPCFRCCMFVLCQ